ncbi:MAG: ABC transporter ATP-binding protein [Acidimicrobiales bacterium]
MSTRAKLSERRVNSSARSVGLVDALEPAQSNTPRLALDSVTKYYSQEPALLDVSFDVEPGSFTVLLGPSGSGKSTLLRCIAGIEKVTAGEISLAGELVASERVHLPPERRELAMVFQDYALWPHMRVIENVTFALRRRKVGATEANRRAREMLERVGLQELSARYPGDLSGGEQQRVGLARALVAAPGVLLLDEPLSNLDADLRERLRVEIATLAREFNATMVYITHDQTEAFALADKVGVLEKGRLVQYASPEGIYSAPATPFVARFTGLAGELRGRVGAFTSSGLVSVELGDRSLLGRSVADWRLREGDPARLLVRSAGVTLIGQDHGGTAVAGTVRDVAFRGRGYDHVVELAGREKLMGVFHPTRHSLGTNVRVQLDPAGCLVFPDDGARYSTRPGTPEHDGMEVEDLALA